MPAALAATFAPSAVDDAAVAGAIGKSQWVTSAPTHDRHVAERSPAIRRLMEHVRQVRHTVEQAMTWRRDDRRQGLSR